MVSGDLAVVRDIWTETVTPAKGAATRKAFRSIEVWRRQPDGNWRIARWIDMGAPYDAPLTAGQQAALPSTRPAGAQTEKPQRAAAAFLAMARRFRALYPLVALHRRRPAV